MPFYPESWYFPGSGPLLLLHTLPEGFHFDLKTYPVYTVRPFSWAPGTFNHSVTRQLHWSIPLVPQYQRVQNAFHCLAPKLLPVYAMQNSQWYFHSPDLQARNLDFILSSLFSTLNILLVHSCPTSWICSSPTVIVFYPRHLLRMHLLAWQSHYKEPHSNFPGSG